MIKNVLFILIASVNCIPLAAQNKITTTRVAQINGALRHLPSNPRYFTDNTGEAIFLTGSHTWENFQDMSSREGRPKFDWNEYLNMMVKNNHNFMRLWRW